jgi:hypothetical protein
MAIVDNYAGITAELRRIRAEKSPPEKHAVAPREQASQHRMRTTIIGDLLYQRTGGKTKITRRNLVFARYIRWDLVREQACEWCWNGKLGVGTPNSFPRDKARQLTYSVVSSRRRRSP